MKNEKSPGLGLWYALGGIAIGAAAELLFGERRPKGWEKSASLAGKLGAMLPRRVRAAAAFGAAKAGSAEAVAAAKEALGLDRTKG